MKRMIVAASNKPLALTPAEQKRCNEVKAMVMRCYEGETEGLYEEDGDTVYTEADELEPNKDWQIDKCYLVYTSNYDENDRRVKKGAKVPGTTYYTISFDGDNWDENTIGCKTMEDAKKFLAICKEDHAAWFNRASKLK